MGKTLEEVRDSLYNGKSGIVFDPERKEMGFRSALTAKIEVPDLKGELSRSQRSFMPEQAKYAYWATRDALQHAHIDQDFLDSHAVGLQTRQFVPWTLSARRRTRPCAVVVLSSSR